MDKDIIMGSWSNFFYRPSYGAQGASEYTLFNTGLLSADAELTSDQIHRLLVSNAHGLVFTGPGAGGGLDTDKLDGLHSGSFLLSGGTAIAALSASDSDKLDGYHFGAFAASAHKVSHQDAGADEISLTGLTGNPYLTGPYVDVRAHGASGDGTTNDTPAFQAAIDTLGITGGMVLAPSPGKYLIDTALTVKRNVTLQGPYNFVVYPVNAAGTEAPFGSMSALVVNSAITITLESAAGINGALIYRKGMTFPEQNTSAFAGTAITLGRNHSFVRNSMILGFNKLIYGNGCDVSVIENVFGDGINGIEIINSTDITRITDVHLWPYGTYFYPTSPVLIRTGTGFKFSGANDWTKVTNSFSYGYNVGFHVANGGGVTLIGCGADQLSVHVNSIG